MVNLRIGIINNSRHLLSKVTIKTSQITNKDFSNHIHANNNNIKDNLNIIYKSKTNIKALLSNININNLLRYECFTYFKAP